jgi:N-methylhydantoinase B
VALDGRGQVDHAATQALRSGQGPAPVEGVAWDGQ